MQNHIYQQRSWGFGRTCSNLLEFITRKVRAAGDGLLAKCLVMPAGKDKTISPVILTMHLEHQAHERREKRHRVSVRDAGGGGIEEAGVTT